MMKTEYNVIGVMSGTSLDGVDLVYVTFNSDTEWEFDIHFTETVTYTDSWLNSLKELTSFSLERIQQIDIDYTNYLAEIIWKFIVTNNIKKIDAICSHGHTALHQPENDITYQIGNLPQIAKLLKLPVVCDFRVQDVEFGGQGAPLVPIGDQLLFAKFDSCLNLGGFANISFEHNGIRLAFDICPVNIVLNYYMRQIGLSYDHNGDLGATGQINKDLLKKLNDLSFYSKEPPKSLGLEWVINVVLPLIDDYRLSIKDVLRTFIEHTAIQISKILNIIPLSSVLITGGGVYNSFLIQRIQSRTNGVVVIPSNEIIEYKEALIFGLLGVLKLRNEINCLSSVTGAVKDHSSGKIYLP
ncbi:anhydro-N-acetylmuramic acid kinase [Flavobacteriales bacterium 34_180_T64]|nr:anhydro-N-acetylmuramic acid kinase [Flavobacteriales bacterium 34_180_T64]